MHGSDFATSSSAGAKGESMYWRCEDTLLCADRQEPGDTLECKQGFGASIISGRELCRHVQFKSIALTLFPASLDPEILTAVCDLLHKSLALYSGDFLVFSHPSSNLGLAHVRVDRSEARDVLSSSALAAVQEKTETEANILPLLNLRTSKANIVTNSSRSCSVGNPGICAVAPRPHDPTGSFRLTECSKCRR